MNKNIFSLFLLIFILLSSCSSSKQNTSLSCSRQFSYKTNKIDIKGITAKLKKAGVEYADVGITDVTIDPKYVVASEKLQQLDLFQYSLCQQLKSLPQTDTLAISLKVKYINALIDMMKIAQTQDSLSKK